MVRSWSKEVLDADLEQKDGQMYRRFLVGVSILNGNYHFTADEKIHVYLWYIILSLVHASNPRLTSTYGGSEFNLATCGSLVQSECLRRSSL
jgi:hypothetical protein